MIELFENARLKYRPCQLRLVFVAEAPPKLPETCDKKPRFFYLDDVPEGDSLFCEMIKLVYLGTAVTASAIRPRKRELLTRFRDDGFYLIDACEDPMLETRTSYKKRRLAADLPGLQQRLLSHCGTTTPIVLISALVYEICAEPLRLAGLNIQNTEMINFPGSGQQAEFRRKLGQLLDRGAIACVRKGGQGGHDS